ncbi:IclR family transcriptional regulator [Sporosarcina newyorkensis]|uniref:Glycerol operon regulatory protein n=1 Tax=Sporosarcina newyorkensis TaxID=759851 RepID=A0A1T4Y898_9BACL|nr:IclR family transcriptional regulator [Sporosarcina newyorkensis]SKA98052.1 transcriptional regulator, IclR family [Sporosarcina newyorkensis]
MIPSDKYMITSVKNAMRMLRLFNSKQTEIGLTSLAEQINVPKSTAHRIASLLVKEGFLSKSPKSGKYRLGLSLLTLGGVVYNHRDIYIEAFPIVSALVQEINETAHICLLENGEVVYLFRKESDRQNRLITSIGRKNPIHCTGEGLCILAFQNKKTVERILSAPLYPYTSKTLTEREDILQELELIRKRGYAISIGQFHEGFMGISAPIRDYSQQVVSSLSIIGSTSTITPDRYSKLIEKVVCAAQDISEHLGYYK